MHGMRLVPSLLSLLHEDARFSCSFPANGLHLNAARYAEVIKLNLYTTVHGLQNLIGDASSSQLVVGALGACACQRCSCPAWPAHSSKRLEA